MKIRKILAATIMSLALVGGSVLTSYAQDKPCCPGGQGKQCTSKGPGCQIPDLTTDQQKQIDALHLSFMKEKIAIKNQIDEKQVHLKTLSMVDQPITADINKTIDEMYLLKADLAKKKESLMQEIRKILTPEQRLFMDMKHSGNGKCHNGGQGEGGCKQQGQGCGGSGQGCQGQGQGCNGQGDGCKGQGQGCKGQGDGCKGQGHGCKGQDDGCKGQGDGCKSHGDGCKGQGQGCKGGGQGCPGNVGSDWQHQQGQQDDDDKK